MSDPVGTAPVPSYGTPPPYGHRTEGGPETEVVHPGPAEPWRSPAPAPAPAALAGVGRAARAARAAVAAPPRQPWPPPEAARRAGIGAVRVLGMLLAGGLVLAGSGATAVSFFEQKRDEYVPVTGRVTRIVTDTRNGDVVIRHAGRRGDPVGVTERLRWAFSKPVVDVNRTDDGILHISARPCSTFLGPCSTDVEVTLPDGMETVPQQLTTDTGNITTDATAAVVAHTSTGDVSVHATGTGDVEVLTDTGDISVQGGGRDASVHARSSTGNISVELDGVPTSVDASADTGDIAVAVPGDAAYAVDTEAGEGDASVQVTRNPTSTHRISARTSTGDVSVTKR